MTPDDDYADAEPVVPRCAEWTLAQCAHALDAVAGKPTRYRMAMAVREEFGVPLLATVTTVVDGNEAALAALLTFEYHLTFTSTPSRRVALEPRDEVIDHVVPPQIRDLPESTVACWRELVELCTTPVMQARLHHLLFARGGRDARAHAIAACDAYVESATQWDRGMDGVDDLSVSLRLARAVRDQDRATTAITRLLDAAQQQLDSDDPKFGLAGRAMEAVLLEPDCPERIDELLLQAQTCWPDPHRLDQILEMQLARATTAEAKAAVWEHRVQVQMDAAAAESAALRRSIFLRKALALADLSGIRALRRTAAAALVGVRGVLDEMVRFGVASRRYDEQFDRVVEAMTVGDTWDASLVRFAIYPPITGRAEVNRELVRHYFANSVMAAVMPAELYSPDGLPYLAGTTEDEKFDIELVRREQENLNNCIRPLARALHSVLLDRPPPPYTQLVGYLDTWPGVFGTASRLADILTRYWAGDADGAAYLAFPVIERMVRELVEASGSGTYRLQRRDTPGQFPPLGTLLPLLTEEYSLDEDRARYLRTVLVHAAGPNLRNLMAHGYVGQVGPPWAAVLIHCALLIATLEPPEAEQPEPDSENDGADNDV